MKTLATTFRHLLLATALPAAFVFSACGDDDDDPVAPQQGKVLVVHAAPSANSAVKVLVGDKEVGQATYGQSSSYVTVNAGAQAVKVNDASSNQTIINPAPSITIEKDKNYSIFAYSPTTTLGSIGALTVPDDLTAPAAGKAKIRIVHLGLSAPSPVTLSLPAPTVGVTDIIPNVAFATTSAFVELAPNTYNLSISTGSGATAVVEASVGDGTGTGTGSKAYLAGKIYTVLVRGIKLNSIDANLRLKAVVIENN